MIPDLHASPSFLLSQVGAQLAAAFAQGLRAVGLTPREYAVLKLTASSEDVLRQQDLADRLGMHRNNMSELLDSMERGALVRRTQHPDDARSFTLIPTQEAQELLAAGESLRRGLDQQVESALGAAGGHDLVAKLQAIGEGLDLQIGVHPHLAASYPGQRRSRRRP